MASSPKPIGDHIFGDLNLPKNSAPYLIQQHRGVWHGYRKTPANPIPQTAVTLLADTSSVQAYADLTLLYTTDEWQTQQHLTFHKTQVEWDALLWGWRQGWEATLPPQPEDTLLRYKLYSNLPDGTRIYADNQSHDFDSATHFTLWYAHNQPPAWAQDAVIYQVFVDRFNPGEGKAWRQTEDLMRPMGGTLRGVTEKLPWIQAMGFNTIWLTPIFPSPTHHGYDTSDYLKINPRFGTMADFDALIEKAHALGMRVILDFVANHCSDQHPAFQDAVRDPASSYHDWFTWQPYPKAKCFYQVPSMPELNLHYGSPARQYLLGVAQNWLKRGADGFRLDYAHGPAQDFWVDFQHACRQVNPDCWTFGEIVAPADRQLSFAGSIDGSLDFLTCQALRETFAQKTWALSQLAGFLKAHQAYFPADFSLPAFIDNHDMNRFLYSAQDDQRALKLALLVLYLLPAAPIIYYGTEVSLSQHQSIHAGGALGFDEARLPMPWELASQTDLPAYLNALASLRQHLPCLNQQEWQLVQVNDRAQTLIQLHPEGYALLINRSETAVTLPLETGDGKNWEDLLTSEHFACQAGIALIPLLPLSARILKAYVA